MRSLEIVTEYFSSVSCLYSSALTKKNGGFIINREIPSIYTIDSRKFNSGEGVFSFGQGKFTGVFLEKDMKGLFGETLLAYFDSKELEKAIRSVNLFPDGALILASYKSCFPDLKQIFEGEAFDKWSYTDEQRTDAYMAIMDDLPKYCDGSLNELFYLKLPKETSSIYYREWSQYKKGTSRGLGNKTGHGGFRV